MCSRMNVEGALNVTFLRHEADGLEVGIGLRTLWNGVACDRISLSLVTDGMANILLRAND